MLDFNSHPYFNDYSADKNFHSILFVPGNPVQARELNQIQSILQEQVKRLGNHFFKNGTVILPGHLFYDPKVKYVKIETTYNDINSESYLDIIKGDVLTGVTSDVTALVVFSEKSTSTDPVTLFVKYTGANGTVNEFIRGEEIVSTGGVTFKVVSSVDYTGDSAICSISEGVYYMNGFFVGVNPQTIVVSKYTNVTNATVGLSFTESIVTEKEDASLYDNAQGFSNYTAPGAQRYKIELTLSTRDLEFTEKGNTLSFTDIMQIKDGVIQYEYNDTQYAEFERLLARRTYDESGDYVVDNFTFTTREYRNNNRGTWTASTPYLEGDFVTITGGYVLKARNDGLSSTTEPIASLTQVIDGGVYWQQQFSTPSYNNGMNDLSETGLSLSDHQEAANKFVVSNTPGKAYIQGYEVKTNGKQLLVANKARNVDYVDNVQISPVVGNTVLITGVLGLPNIDIVQPILIKNIAGTTIGSANVRSIEYVSGTLGSATCIYKIHMINVSTLTGYDVVFNSDTFANSGGNTFTGTFVKSFIAESVFNGTMSTGGASSTTINGKGTLFSKQLKAGMVIAVGTAAYPSNLRRIISITDDVTLTVDSVITLTGDNYFTAQYIEYSPIDVLLTELPVKNVRSVRSKAGTNEAEYFAIRQFANQTSNGSGQIVLTLPTNSNETFFGSGHLVVKLSDNVVANASYNYTVGNTTVTISGLSNSVSYTCHMAMKRVSSAAKEKTKMVSSKVVTILKADGTGAGGIIDNTSDYATYTTANLIPANAIAGTTGYNSGSNSIPLTEADGIRLIKVVTLDTSGAIPTEKDDITSWFTFDNGQAPTIYDVAKIIKRADVSGTIASHIRVVFDYFAHSDGDYFTADSYVGLGYNQIPSVQLQQTTYKLSDCIDFRPRVADVGTGFATSGASVTSPLQSNNVMSLSFSYYLARIDNISLNSNGEFIYTYGRDSLYPVEPSLTSEVLKLATLNVPAYTQAASQITQSSVTHRRYTMSDISKLDSRLENVEQYVALTLLEKQTADMQVLDENGLDRYKSGFLVDQFKDIQVLDQSSSCSIDTARQVMTVPFNTRSVGFVEKSTTESGYYSKSIDPLKLGTGESVGVTNKDYATVKVLSYDTPILQPGATRSVPINPFSVMAFNGESYLYPAEDMWDETAKGVVEVKQGRTINWSSAADRSVWNQLTNNRTPAQQLDALIREKGGSFSLGTSAGDRAAANFLNQSTDTVVTMDSWANSGLLFWGGNWWSNTAGDNLHVSQTVETTLGSDSYLTAAPNMRQKKIVAIIEGLKPNTQIYAYMDGNNFSSAFSHCTLLYLNTLVTGTAPFKGYKGTNKKDNINERLGTVVLAGGGYDEYSYGDVIKGATSNATGVVVACELINVGYPTWAVYVANVKGTFTTESVGVLGQATSASITSVVNPSSMKTNSLGNYYGVIGFSESYSTGQKSILFTDSTSFGGSPTTQTSTTYRAYGNILTNREVIRRDVLNYDVSFTTQNQVFQFSDPLAQTFLLPQSYSTGAISTFCTLYFAKASNANTPIYVEIVEVDNGIPTRRVLPNAVAKVSEAYIYSLINGKTDYDKANLGINLAWQGPVFIEANREYAIKIRSDSLTAEVWVSQMGEKYVGSFGTGNVQTEQPNTSTIGVFFKSQNNSTWTPEQLQDLKFSISTCVFDTTKSGVIDLYTKKPTPEKLESNPFKILASSKTVRVSHKNHGFVVGHSVSYSGSTYANTNNLTTTVSRVLNDDVYYVDMVNAAVTTESVGGGLVYATPNIEYDQFGIKVESLIPSTKTGVTYEAAHSDQNSVSDSSFTVFNGAGTPSSVETSKYVLSSLNQPATNLGGCNLRMLIWTSDAHLSPIIDTSSISGSFRSHRINTPSKSDFVTATGVDRITIYSGVPGAVQVFTNSGTENYISVSSSLFDTTKAKVGAYLKISGANNVANNTIDGSEAMILKVDQLTSRIYVDMTLTTGTEAANTVTIEMYDTYVDEINPSNGSSEAKYVSREVTLQNPATSLKVIQQINAVTGADFDLYYRVGMKDSYSKLRDSVWTKYPVTYIATSPAQFVDKTYDIEALPSFDAFQIKIVAKSADSSIYPSFKELRVLALA